MTELKTAEELVRFMQSGSISLSRYDAKFIDNLGITDKITSNQITLFNKLVYKYRKQLSKHGVFSEEAVVLPWTINVIESSPKYTDGHVSITDSMIMFKCPFNRNFINDFRKQDINQFSWSKDNRQYEAEYSTASFKMLLKVASKFFKNIQYCENSIDILSKVGEYGTASCWEPTLKRVNGNLIIVAINEHLYNAINDIVLDTKPVTLSRLASYGITIDPSIYEDDAKLKFMAEMQTTVEQSELLNIVSWLIELECDYIYFSGSTILSQQKKTLKEMLDTANIPFCDVTTYSQLIPTTTFNFPVLVRFKQSLDKSFDPQKVGKIIQLVNSQAIDIK